MDLFEDELLEEKKKVKKMGKWIIIGIVLAVIACIAILCAMVFLQKKKLGVNIDGVLTPFPQGTFFTEDSGKVYLSIRDVSTALGYTYYNGEYGKASEDQTKGFIQSIDEVASFESNSKKINKILLKEKAIDNQYNYLYIDEPIKYINGKLYTTQEGIKRLFNVQISYNETTNKIDIFTLNYLYNYYTANIMSYGYQAVASEFVNQKSMIYDMLIVTNDQGRKGIIDTEGKVIVGAKYDDITYNENTNEFFIEYNSKVGLVNNLGKTKIDLRYEDIQLLDNDLGLYVAKSNGKYGVINKQGEIVIYIEYDKVGIDKSLYKSSDIENPYLLYDNCIPVEKDKKWGVFDKKGKVLLAMDFDSIGCVVSTGQSNTNNVILLPDYEAFIVGKDFEVEVGNSMNKVKKYGVFNSLGEQLVDFVIDSIYYITQDGKDIYQLEKDGSRGNLEEIFERSGIKKVNKDVINTNHGSGDINIVSGSDNSNIISNNNGNNNINEANP